MIFFTIVASLAGIAVIVCMCLQQSGPDAGFSAAMGGSSWSSSRNSGTDLLLERAMKVSGVVWILACLALAVVTAHTGGGGAAGGPLG